MTEIPSLALLVVALVLAGVAAGMAALLRAVRRQAEQQRQALSDHGFSEAPETVEELAARLPALQTRGFSHFEVRKPFRKADWGYYLYLFDLRTGSGKSAELKSSQTMVVSPDLALPRFSLAPKAPGDGLMAELANRAIGWIASKFATRVEFPDHPAFDAKYFLFGDDAAALRRYFTDRRLSRLAEFNHLQVAGSGDAFLYERTPYPRVKKMDREKLQDLQEDARTLYEILKA